VISDPGFERIEAHDVWTVKVEAQVRDGVSAVVEFASVDGERPLVREITFVNDLLVPTEDLDTRDVRKFNLDPLRDTATTKISEFQAKNVAWSERVKIGPDGSIPRKRGRPRTNTDTFYAVIARDYVDVCADLQQASAESALEPKRKAGSAASWRERSIYRLMAKRRAARGEASRSADRLRKDIAVCRSEVRNLLSATTHGRSGGELTPECDRLLDEYDRAKQGEGMGRARVRLTGES